MSNNKILKGPQFVRFFGPTVDALQALGGSGRPAEVFDWIATKLRVSEKDQNEMLSSGQSRFANQIHWAKFYLSKAGFIDSSSRGIWTLTEKGLSAKLSHKDALTVFQNVQAEVKHSKSIHSEIQTISSDIVEVEVVEQNNHRTQLMEILRNLPASGFERLCQLLLRKAGFQNVNVTGRSGDGGIDGNGILQVNPFVSFRVLFQCKKYSGSVSSPQIRDFRGAMMGRADKGIILTTGTFTKDARQEAVRDGVPSIELVDGKNLLDMFEQLQLGLQPVIAYQIDDDFFNEFRS